ncbi:MAG: SAM-dependent methyltransferase [Helicobacteraceae bacterium]|jgi:SAM-dependent MidA family methyltransferase|nr:SAM-dependent methyltransferase [Helicobacteraceae bacterium]
MTIFGDYAQEWLYGAGGYYRNAPAIGMRGDFYTAVTISPFFGGAIANEIARRVESGDLAENAAIVEFGAHNARLIADIIQFIFTIKKELAFSLNFCVVEPIAKLREIQKSYLDQSFGEAIKILIADDLKNVKNKNVFAIANELFDAFAFDLINGEKIAFVEDHKIVWKEARNFEILEIAKTLGVDRGEIFRGFFDFAKNLRDNFENVKFLTFDYGELSPRNDFSARIFTQNATIPLFEIENLRNYYQKCDLTADIPFFYLRNCFEKAGFAKIKITRQNSALINMGLTELLDIYQTKRGFEAYQKELGRVNVLLNPAQMGEKFKCFYAETV